MSTLAFKLALTPALIAAATLAGGRWGQGVSGWLVAFPLTSGPLILFVALDYGTTFAAAVAVGSLGGAIAQAAFSLGYGWVAGRATWPFALLTGSLSFGAAVVALERAPLAPLPLLAAVSVGLGLALWLMPQGSDAVPTRATPWWDVPARMVVATALVVLLAGGALALGPRLSGLLGTFPIYAATLTVFGHRLQGPTAAVQVLRGLLAGLFSFAGFCFIVATLIESLGIAAAFAAAIVVSLVIQGAALACVLAATRASARMPATRTARR